MTVRELINALLDSPMDAEVVLQTPDPCRAYAKGVWFGIERVCGYNYPTIMFKDWRDETDERRIKE